MGRDSRARQQAEASGRSSEALAALYLRLKGYQPLDQRVRMPGGEIDLILRKGQLIIFAEVKRRVNLDDALTAVTEGNWQRIARAGDVWRARRPDLEPLGWRYDLIALAPGRWPVHVRDAWRPGLC